LFSFSKKEEFHNVDIKQLNESNQKRMDYIIKNKICYIGGTISPADKDEETHKLESLKKGLDYYKDKCETVVLQPKYMGSRAQFYIEKDIEKCYATSRNGYKIKTELKTVFNEWQIKLTNLFKKYNASQIILDGELMPWSAMGEELIDSHFKVVDNGIKSEIDFLKENGFDEAFNKLCENYKNTDYNVDKNNMNKKQLMEKYGHQYNNFKDLAGEMDKFVSIEKHEEAWKTYHEQIEIYGDNSSEIHYKAFRILKIIDMNGNIVNIDMTNEEQFKSINDDSVIVIDFSPESYKKAEYWYAKLVSMYKMEGCVIKPNKTKEGYNNIAPYMKVRNRDYLTIIYGYDMYFDKKFDKLFKQKSINRKIKASISEYNIGEKMLKSNIESSEFKQLVANFMFENEAEITIDPRL
jgi:hypothetical protein